MERYFCKQMRFINSCLLFAILLICNIVKGQKVLIQEPFDKNNIPAAPDYSKNNYWAALPFVADYADTPAGKGQLLNMQATAVADVFFIHPTSFTEKPKGPYKWNGNLNDQELNKKTDESSIRYQASLFNAAGRIYAPRYRQAHYSSYLTKDTASARQAFEIAYNDVKTAFEYYLNHHNNNRLIIIASHSQGTTHAIRLLQEFFDNKPLAEKLVCAYLVGMPVYDTMFVALKPCSNAEEIQCYCTWRTYATGYYPHGYITPKKLTVCTNPLSWSTSNEYVSNKNNRGGTTKNFSKIIPYFCDAQVADGVLRINKPNIKGTKLLRINNYHVGDYNLFYVNVRENATLRVKMANAPKN